MIEYCIHWIIVKIDNFIGIFLQLKNRGSCENLSYPSFLNSIKMIYRPKKPNSKRQYIACRMVFIGKYNFLYMKEYFLSSKISVLKWSTIFSLSFCISICITALIASYSTLVVPVFLPDGTCSCEKCTLHQKKSTRFQDSFL